MAIPCHPDNVSDIATFKSLPQTLTVYRGGSSGGYSWTLSKEKAQWFSRRNVRNNKQHKGELWQLDIDKSEIAWYTNGRNEKEVIIIEHKNTPKPLN